MHSSYISADVAARKNRKQVDPIFDTPRAVSQHLLEVTRQAYLNRDFSVFEERFVLPQICGSFEGDQLLETSGDLKTIFESMLSYFDRIGVVDIRRRTLAAQFESESLVTATFVSHYVLPGFLVSDDIVAHGKLIFVDGLWRIHSHRYATDMQGVSDALTAASKPIPIPRGRTNLY